MKIEDLNNLNQWWKFGKDFWKYDRNLKEVKNALIEFKRRRIPLDKGNIYVLRGNRQTGKTTYIKQTILDLLESTGPNSAGSSSILYVSCDKLSPRKELSNIISNFIQANRDLKKLYIFLDEITYLEDWVIELKALADSNFIDKLVILATGSNPVRLKEKSERMPGRRVEGNEYYFKPLTFREFVLQSIDKVTPRMESAELKDALNRLKEKLKNISINLESDANSIMDSANSISAFKEELEYLLGIYLLTGGFPAVINEYLNAKFVNKQEIIKNELYETMIRIVLGDVSKIGRSEIIATEIMKGIVKRYSTRYSFTKIGSDIGFPHQTVIDYLEILENSFMLQVLYPFDISSMKIKFKGDKKIYFSDPFIYHAVNSFVTGAEGFALSKETLLHDKDKLVESVVMNHLSQAKEVPYLKEWKNYLGFFYSATGRETDFIYKRNDNTLVGVEVKYREEAERELAKMDKIKEYLVLTKNQLKISDGVAFIPVSLFLVLLEKSEKLI